MKLWHQRLRHVSSAVLSRLFSVNQQTLCTLSECSVCPYNKQKRLAFLVNSNKTVACFDLICLDVWVPMMYLQSMLASIFLILLMIFEG